MLMMHESLSQFGLKIPGIRNAWSPWIDHIMDQKQKFGFDAAAILSDSAAYLHDSTKHFIPSEPEVKVSHACIISEINCILLIIALSVAPSLSVCLSLCPSCLTSACPIGLTQE